MKYIHLESTDSTNRYAKADDMTTARQTALVVADRQTEGRGRLGRSFISADGGLYMSLLFFPKGSAEKVSLFTPLMALAVCTAISEFFAVDTNIKWVNDIYLNGKKLCGILSEAEPCGNGVKYAVVGVGINLAFPEGGFDSEIADIATALLPEGTDINTYRETLARRIAELFLKYTESDSAVLLEEYRRRMIYVNEKVTVFRFDESYEATVLGVDEQFGLVVSNISGERLVLHSGEISIRPSEGQS